MAEKEYKVYLRSENRFIEVPRDFYYSYYRPIWALMQRLRLSGECICPKKMACYCDGDCLICKYHVSTTYSLDEPFDESGLCLSEIISSDDYYVDNNIENMELSEMIKEELLKLSDKEFRTCQLISEGATFEEIAKALDLSKGSAYRYVNRVKKHLKECMLSALVGAEGGDSID